jgi:hypothetical protein
MVKLLPSSIPRDCVSQLLERVGLGSETTEMTKLIMYVRTLEAQLQTANTEIEAANAEIKSLRQKLGE